MECARLVPIRVPSRPFAVQSAVDRPEGRGKSGAMRRPAFAVPLLLLVLASLNAQDYDLVIRGGKVVDGSGRPAVAADIGVRSGRVVALGEVKGRGRTEIDAAGQTVAPGFIDVHTHS